MGLEEPRFFVDENVEELVTAHMKYHEKRLRDKLEAVQYQVTSGDNLSGRDSLEEVR